MQPPKLGRNVFRVLILIAIGIAINLVQIAAADKHPPIVKLEALSLDDLAQRLKSAPLTTMFQDKAKLHQESILIELVRRGGSDAANAISKHLNELEAKRTADLEELKSLRAKLEAPKTLTPDEIDSEIIGRNYDIRSNFKNLALITALRRIKQQLDPLAVIVDHPADIKGSLRSPPVIKVVLQNVDSEKQTLEIQKGGDYRSGRQERWRIHVWDANGKLLPELPRLGLIGGGFTDDGALVFGEKWETELELASYVKIRHAGKYKVQILYHDQITISDIKKPEDLNDLIVFRSEPFELNVEHGPKIPIRLTGLEMNKARSHVKSLHEKDPLRIFIGKYDKEAHSFIDPKSPQGELLALEWKAVPALLDALEDKNLSFRKRAWILGLLYSITHEPDFDPTDGIDSTLSGLLPEYEMRGNLVSSVNNGPGSFGLTFTRSTTDSGGAENLSEQQAMASRWLQFREEFLNIQIDK